MILREPLLPSISEKSAKLAHVIGLIVCTPQIAVAASLELTAEGVLVTSGIQIETNDLAAIIHSERPR